MMSSILRIELFGFSILFLILVLKILQKGNLTVKYSIFWISISLFLIISSLFPNFIGLISNFFGFKTTINMLLVFAIFVLFFISLVLSIKVSKHSAEIKKIIQQVSLINSEIRNNK